MGFKKKEPDDFTVSVKKHNQTNIPYSNREKNLPDNTPEPKGKKVIISHMYDTNLMYDVLSGKSVTGVFYMANQTPMMWYSKKQAIAETSTYGSGFLMARKYMEQIVDLRNVF